jgi:AraC-like DNA-binding protein
MQLKLEVEKSKAILNPKAAEKKFQLSRHVPAQDLSYFVNHYWIVSWDLSNQEPYLQEVLPHPCVNLVIEKDHSRIAGVTTGKFSYLLKGKGMVFAVMFRPGGFYPFVKFPVSTLTDRAISFQDAFGVESNGLEEAMLSLQDKGKMVELVEQFLREKLPEQDKNVELINQIIDHIIANREITRVDDVVSQLNISKRTLQRMFRQYIGVSPKWVIKRYRLHEAAKQVADGGAVNWSKLALDLGYFDQTHFIKDFKGIVGKSPAEYTMSIGRETDAIPG